MSATLAPNHGRIHVVRHLASGWWLLLLRGIVSILFGLFAFVAPTLGLAVILGVLAAWLAIDGVLTLWEAVTGRSFLPAGTKRHGFWLWFDGLVSLAAAAVLIFMPMASAMVLVIFVGAWSVVTGVFRLVLAWRMGSWLMGLLGVLGVVVGLWLMAQPGPGLVALIWVVAIQAVFGGILLIGLAFRLRRVAQEGVSG